MASVCTNVVLGNGKTGGSLTGSNPPAVAVFYAGSSSTDLHTKLLATGAFSSVPIINVNTTVPTVAQMKAYDAVVVFTYISAAATLGDNLADYFEQGGGVVVPDYESQETGSFGFKGRFATQYTMSTPIASGSWLTAKVTLGTVNDPTNPLMNQVVTFGYQGTSPYHMATSAFNLNNPIFVALYSDGTPAIIRGVVASGPAAGRNLIEINGFGHSSTGFTSYGWDATTDGAKLFRNALLYSMPPPIATAAQQVSFGSQPLYTPTAPQALTYTNVSTSSQTITALSLSGAHIGDFAFSPSFPLPYTVAPGATFVVNVTFSPSSTGLRAATLSATVQGIASKITTLLSGTGL